MLSKSLPANLARGSLLLKLSIVIKFYFTILPSSACTASYSVVGLPFMSKSTIEFCLLGYLDESSEL